MKKILFLLCIPPFLFSMQKDQVPEINQQIQTLRPKSFMEAILQINRSLPFRLLLEKEIPDTEFNKLPPELLIMMSNLCFFDVPQIIHAIDYIIDAIDGQLSLQRNGQKNKLDKIKAFIDSCPLPLSTAIKESFVKKYRWKYKSSLARNSNTIWLNGHDVHLPSTITLDNQQVTATGNGTINVTDLKTNQTIFSTQMRFSNPRLLLHDDPTRLLIKDSTNYVTQIIWYLPSSFNTIINKQQAAGEKRKHTFIKKEKSAKIS